eukprot:scaffold27218_cov227-Skeletonema_marinoi.AAC.2
MEYNAATIYKGIARTVPPKLAYTPPPNLSLGYKFLYPPLQDTRGKLGDIFDLYPPQTQPSLKFLYPPGGIVQAIPLYMEEVMLPRSSLSNK